MSGVLIASGCPIGTSTLYRCIHLQEQFVHAGVNAVVEEWFTPHRIREESVRDYEILILYRLAMDNMLRRVIDTARARGKIIIFDTDDLVFEPHLTHWHRGVNRLTEQEKALYADGVKRYLATLEASDFVTTATPFLARLARRRNKIAFVHRNALGLEMQALADHLFDKRQRRPSGKRVVIGYGSGTPTHDVDFQQAAPALLDIMAHYPSVELWLAGPLELPEALHVFSDRIRRHPLRGWQDWFKLAINFDINLAPLEAHNIFCRAKSEIKFVEAAALGIPTVASHIDPFIDAIAPGVDGFLASNEQDWIEGIKTLIDRPEQRIAVGLAARQTVAARYSLTARLQDLRRTVGEIKSTTRPVRGFIGHSGSGGVSPEATTAEKLGDIPTDQAPAESEMDAKQFVPLVINWLVSEPLRGSGGHTGIFRMVRYLIEYGHECHVYILPVQHMYDLSAEELRQFVDTNFLVTGADFHRWTGEVYDADATIATYWETAHELDTLPSAARRYYLVQDFEPFFYPMGSEYIHAENTYRKGYHCITLGSWLAKLLRDRYHAQADHFDFAANAEIYYPRAVERSSIPRVAFYARPSTPRRAYTIGLKALQLVKAQQPNIEIVLFGSDELDPPPPFAHTNLGILNDYELATLYSGCDVGLVLSLTNPSLVPFEMMACRCPVVDLRNEQTAELLTDGETALLADPSPETLAQAVLQLVQNRTLSHHIAEQGYQHVSNRSWRDSARQIEAILLKHAPPDEERCFKRRQQNGEVATLLWQVNRLLDNQEDSDKLLDQLRDTLYRVLAEKARMSGELQHAEQEIEEAHRHGELFQIGQALNQLQGKFQEYTPGWVLGCEVLSTVPLAQEGLWQTFRADRSHLRRIELLFAPISSLHVGSIQILLYTGKDAGNLVAERIVSAAELHPDTPYVFSFSPQADSYQQLFTLGILPSGSVITHGYAMWRFWSLKHANAQLQYGSRAVRGQLAFQTFYGESESKLQTGRSGPHAWGVSPRPVTALVQEAVAFAGVAARESYRLSKQAKQTVLSHGVNGLVDETVSYLQWRMSNGRD